MVYDREHDIFYAVCSIYQTGVMNIVFGQGGTFKQQIMERVEVYHVTRQTPSNQHNIRKLLLIDINSQSRFYAHFSSSMVQGICDNFRDIFFYFSMILYELWTLYIILFNMCHMAPCESFNTTFLKFFTIKTMSTPQLVYNNFRNIYSIFFFLFYLNFLKLYIFLFFTATW